jgi:hypothetical protein
MTEFQFSILALLLTALILLVVFCLWRLGVVLDDLQDAKRELYQIRKRVS